MADWRSGGVVKYLGYAEHFCAWRLTWNCKTTAESRNLWNIQTCLVFKRPCISRKDFDCCGTLQKSTLLMLSTNLTFFFSGCFAFWCFPCFACKTAHEAGECLCLPLLDSFGAIPPITTALRVSVRQRYGIEVQAPCFPKPHCKVACHLVSIKCNSNES